jgi:hypothetical protein
VKALRLVLLGVAGTLVLLALGFGTLFFMFRHESEIGSWRTVEEAVGRMREEASPGPRDGQLPVLLADLPVEEVLGWREHHPIHGRNFVLLVRMERNWQPGELMELAGNYGESGEAPLLPSEFEELGATEVEKDRYLSLSLTADDCTLFLSEMDGERRWLIEAIW